MRVARAVAAVGEIGRVHVCRWGDGGAHFHVWFIAWLQRLPQLKGSFVAICQPGPVAAALSAG